MKRFLLIILGLTLLISITACAQNEKPSESGLAPSAATEAPGKDFPGSGEEVVLTVTGWRVEDLTGMEAMNEIFMADHPNIKIVYEPVKATEYDTYLSTSMSNKTCADIVMVRSYTGGKAVYGSGNLVALDETNVPPLALYPQSALGGWMADDGTVFAVPAGMSIASVHYNKKIFEECGIEGVPDTVDELYAACKAISEKGYFPLAVGMKDAWNVSELITSTILAGMVGSSEWAEKLYDREINFEDEGYVSMLRTVNNLSEFFPEGYEGLSYEDCQQMFVSEQAGIYFSGTFEIPYFQETNPDLQLGAMAFPGLEKASTAINIAFATSWGIYSETEHMDEALIYVNWLASKEGSEAYTNNVGFIGLNPEIERIENDVVAEWHALTNDRELSHCLGYKAMVDQSPDYTTAIADTVYQMLHKDLSPEEAASYMQQQMAWYFQ